jgi:hypothetical protein
VRLYDNWRRLLARNVASGVKLSLTAMDAPIGTPCYALRATKR